jgi:hypothetical protein
VGFTSDRQVVVPWSLFSQQGNVNEEFKLKGEEDGGGGGGVDEGGGAGSLRLEDIQVPEEGAVLKLLTKESRSESRTKVGYRTNLRHVRSRSGG